MKKFVTCFSLIICLFLLNNKNVKADTLGINILCDKNVTSNEEALNYDYPNNNNYTYQFGDEVVCYVVVGHSGNDGYDKVELILNESDGLEFVKFEENDIWTNVTKEGNRYVLTSNEEIMGSFVVGKLYYKLISDKAYSYINAYVLGMDAHTIISTVSNETPVESPDPVESLDPVGTTNNNSTKNTCDNSSNNDILLYVSLGINALLVIIVIILLITKKKYKNNAM